VRVDGRKPQPACATDVPNTLQVLSNIGSYPTAFAILPLVPTERVLFRSSSVTSYTATLSYTATSTAPGAFRSNSALLEMVPLLLGKSVVIVNRYREGLLVQEEEMSHSHDAQTQEPSADWINSIEKLIRWIAPRTAGRARVLDRLADVKTARSDRRRLHNAFVCFRESSMHCTRKAR
jgi:hypothetical protein